MPWSDFIGNAAVVDELRGLIAGRGALRTLVIAGPRGIGKTTLAVMAGLALNCLDPPTPGDFCGQCESCRQAQPISSIPQLIETALDYRQTEVRGEAKQSAPLTISLHPSIRIFPPDSDFFSIHQARAVTRLNQTEPDSGRVWCVILPDFDQSRWMVQASMLKTLEEPSPRVAIFALVRNPLELLSTVRSRAMILRLAPLPTAELESTLREWRRAHNQLEPDSPEMRARLANGCPGLATTLDLDQYLQVRAEALTILRGALAPVPDASLFRVTDSLRGGKEKFESLVEILYSILQDILYLQSGLSDAVRNMDCVPELSHMAQQMGTAALPRAIEALDRLQSAARRNAYRPLALESWALSVAGS